mmetsp:Transcript_148350/g.258786  ORF Transcript_148350/g.258786 Transcript_148350/m.258786 type:complete len:451 (+) Transcript_148350:79-1431(+)
MAPLPVTCSIVATPASDGHRRVLSARPTPVAVPVARQTRPGRQISHSAGPVSVTRRMSFSEHTCRGGALSSHRGVVPSQAQRHAIPVAKQVCRSPEQQSRKTAVTGKSLSPISTRREQEPIGPVTARELKALRSGKVKPDNIMRFRDREAPVLCSLESSAASDLWKRRQRTKELFACLAMSTQVMMSATASTEEGLGHMFADQLAHDLGDRIVAMLGVGKSAQSFSRCCRWSHNSILGSLEPLCAVIQKRKLQRATAATSLAAAAAAAVGTPFSSHRELDDREKAEACSKMLKEPPPIVVAIPVPGLKGRARRAKITVTRGAGAKLCDTRMLSPPRPSPAVSRSCSVATSTAAPSSRDALSSRDAPSSRERREGSGKKTLAAAKHILARLGGGTNDVKTLAAAGHKVFCTAFNTPACRPSPSASESAPSANPAAAGTLARAALCASLQAE